MLICRSALFIILFTIDVNDAKTFPMNSKFPLVIECQFCLMVLGVEEEEGKDWAMFSGK